MQRGVRSLHGDLASFTISSFNGVVAHWMTVEWSSLKNAIVILLYFAVQHGVRSLHGDVVFDSGGRYNTQFHEIYIIIFFKKMLARANLSECGD